VEMGEGEDYPLIALAREAGEVDLFGKAIICTHASSSQICAAASPLVLALLTL